MCLLHSGESWDVFPLFSGLQSGEKRERELSLLCHWTSWDIQKAIRGSPVHSRGIACLYIMSDGLFPPPDGDWDQSEHQIWLASKSQVTKSMNQWPSRDISRLVTSLSFLEPASLTLLITGRSWVTFTPHKWKLKTCPKDKLANSTEKHKTETFHREDGDWLEAFLATMFNNKVEKCCNSYEFWK